MANKVYVGIPAEQSLADIIEGSIVKIQENGTYVDFYVAKHNYESELNGVGRTLLVRKDCYSQMAWDDETLAIGYPDSLIDSWINSEYKSLFNSNIQEAMSTTTFDYLKIIWTLHGDTDSWTTEAELATLSRSVFLLSPEECDCENKLASTTLYGQVGTALPTAETIRMGYYQGSAISYWTRVMRYGMGTYGARPLFIRYTGSVGSDHSSDPTGALGVRPAFTLPSTIKVFDYMITGGTTSPTPSVARRVKSIYIGERGFLKSVVDVPKTIDNSTYDSDDGTTYEWNNRNFYTITEVEDYLQIQVKTIASAGKMYHCKRYHDTPIIGRNGYTRKLILVTAMIRGYSTNVGYPWMGAYYNFIDSETFGKIATDLETGATETGLNDGQWHKVGQMYQTCSEDSTGSAYYDHTGIAFGICPPNDTTKVSSNDKFDLKDLCVFDLTEVYGRGNEPTKDWCIANLFGKGTKVDLINLPNKAHKIKKAYLGDSNGIAQLWYAKADPEDLIDFEYTDNGDGTYTITGWKGTYSGNSSTKIIIPDGANIIW